MLSEFVADNRAEIIARARAKVAQRAVPSPIEEELERGIPLFVDQLAEALRTHGGTAEMAASAALHGADMILQELITRSLAEVRVDSAVQHRERVNVHSLVEELEVEGAMAAAARNIRFTVTPVPRDIEIDADAPSSRRR